MTARAQETIHSKELNMWVAHTSRNSWESGVSAPWENLGTLIKESSITSRDGASKVMILFSLTN